MKTEAEHLGKNQLNGEFILRGSSPPVWAWGPRGMGGGCDLTESAVDVCTWAYDSVAGLQS